MDEGDGDGEGDRVLPTFDLPQTLKRGLAPATCKGHRVLHANKEIRLNDEALGTHVASEASSPRARSFRLVHPAADEELHGISAYGCCQSRTARFGCGPTH